MTEPRTRRLDIALVPISAYEPRWFMQSQHVNVEEALGEPPRPLARQRAELGLAKDAFFALAIGETRPIPRRD